MITQNLLYSMIIKKLKLLENIYFNRGPSDNLTRKLYFESAIMCTPTLLKWTKNGKVQQVPLYVFIERCFVNGADQADWASENQVVQILFTFQSIIVDKGGEIG